MTDDRDPMRIGRYHRMDIVSDSGVIILRRLDGSEVARFSRAGATLEQLERAARKDHERPESD